MVNFESVWMGWSDAKNFSKPVCPNKLLTWFPYSFNSLMTCSLNTNSDASAWTVLSRCSSTTSSVSFETPTTSLKTCHFAYPTQILEMKICCQSLTMIICGMHLAQLCHCLKSQSSGSKASFTVTVMNRSP